jgi:hypothetical protein
LSSSKAVTTYQICIGSQYQEQTFNVVRIHLRIAVDGYDELSVAAQRRTITRDCGSANTSISIMADDSQPLSLRAKGCCGGAIGAGVVDNINKVDEVRQLSHGACDEAFFVVGRYHGSNSLASPHSLRPLGASEGRKHDAKVLDFELTRDDENANIENAKSHRYRYDPKRSAIRQDYADNRDGKTGSGDA